MSHKPLFLSALQFAYSRTTPLTGNVFSRMTDNFRGLLIWESSRSPRRERSKFIQKSSFVVRIPLADTTMSPNTFHLNLLSRQNPITISREFRKLLDLVVRTSSSSKCHQLWIHWNEESFISNRSRLLVEFRSQRGSPKNSSRVSCKWQDTGTEIRYLDPSALPRSKMAKATVGSKVYTVIMPLLW